MTGSTDLICKRLPMTHRGVCILMTKAPSRNSSIRSETNARPVCRLKTSASSRWQKVGAVPVAVRITGGITDATDTEAAIELNVTARSKVQ